jgi:hypothetical protein
MGIDPLKEKIVKYLQKRYRKTGVNSPVSWRTIWIELGVTEKDFSKALQATDDDILIVDDDHIKLGRSRLD